MSVKPEEAQTLGNEGADAYLWDWGTSSIKALSVSSEFGTFCSYQDGGTTVACVTDTGSMTIWESRTGAIVRQFPTNPGSTDQ
jgi:hypothetical protein